MKLSLAPIQGMTLAHYRNLYAEIFGSIDEYYSPFIGTTDMRKASKVLFKDILPEVNNKDLKIIPQLLGNNPDDFRYFASRIVDMGYKEINWNIGCPFPMVTNKKKGSGILPYPEMIKKFLDEVCLDDSYDLTIKLRLGLEEIEEGIEVINLLNNYPLKGIAIHGRTGIQKYTGHVNLDAFDEMYKLSKHEVTYNGDIFTLDDYKRIQARFPDIDHFMLGRGGLRNPFLASEIKGITTSADQKYLKIKKFHDAVFDYYSTMLSGDKHVGDKMKEFWTYLSVHVDPSGKFMKKIKKSRTSAAYLDIVNQMFNNAFTWHDVPK